MKNKKFLMIAAVFVITSFIGGSLAGRVAKPQQAKAQASETISSQTFLVFDADGNTRILVTNDEDNQPNLIFMNEKAEVRAVYSLTKTGEPIITMNDKKTNPRSVAAVLDDSGPGIEMYDKDAKVLWSAP